LTVKLEGAAWYLSIKTKLTRGQTFLRYS
jgi:hypothetical protein